MNRTPIPIPQAPFPDAFRWRDVQLELSLKPFYDTSEATREAVLTELFHQWLPICRYSDSISVMFWIGDGSEILEFDGDLEREFEWGRYQGSANRQQWHPPPPAEGESAADHAGIDGGNPAADPEGLGLHRRSYLYRPDPARFTYRWLRDTVAAIRRIGAEITGKRIQVGETFDIGPEFAVSRFKFDWHREILSTSLQFAGKFIVCDGVLHADSRKYAGYPQGIPEGTPIGRFLGRQSRCLFEAVGFDFLWFSNGFGFAMDPWSLVGRIFDGQAYHPDQARETAEHILQFWREFRAEFPAQWPVRTRGTNLGTSVDLASDASPIGRIFSEIPAVDAPVNSPWAALDGDLGIELAGWMSHIARRPGNAYRYRFYAHDPWWNNSPWLDRYDREPYDIFLPLSVSRLDDNGDAEGPRDLAILTVDDAYGRMPPIVPAEIIPHILRCRERGPDAPGPFVWVYPFDDLHRIALDEGRPQDVMWCDWVARGAINQGFPLNTVADETIAAAHPEALAGRVLVTPAPEPGTPREAAVRARLEAGFDTLLYGPLQPGSVFLEPLGLRTAEPLAGDFDLELRAAPEGECLAGGQRLRHLDFLSGGGWSAAPAPGADPAAHRALGRRGAESRVALAARTLPNGARLAWVRGALSSGEYRPERPAPIVGPLLRPMHPEKFFAADRLVRFAMDVFGWRAVVPQATPDQRRPYLTAHRNRNGYVFSGYHPDATVDWELRCPLGAPLLEGGWNVLRGGRTLVRGATAWQRDVRVFIEGQTEGRVFCRYQPSIGYGVQLRLLLTGLKGARVHFLPISGTEETLKILRDPVFPYIAGRFEPAVARPTPEGSVITIENVEGELLFSW